MSARQDDRRFLRYLESERDAARMYRALAELTDDDPREALLELASIEDRHAAHWESKLIEKGIPVPPDSGQLQPESAAVLKKAQELSVNEVLPELEESEREAQGEYDDEPDALPGMANDERLHALVLSSLGTHGKGPGSAALLPSKTSGKNPNAIRESLNNAEDWHRLDKSGSVRAAIFGISDGLVSNTALVMGFAGSGISSGTVLFAGLAGLLAGAFSMAAGEYVSVASQRDLFGREIALEKEELETKPLEEQRELELLYRAKGVDPATAAELAERIMSDPHTALDTLVREELGLDPDELGSPIKVAGSSFASFVVGAAVPVIPYLFSSGTTALILAVIMAAIALLIVGAAVGHSSGAGMVKSAIRQLAVGASAAIVTYVIGRIIGVSLN